MRAGTVAELLKALRPLIIAHRGNSTLAPENTLPAFQLALDGGADAIELDYHHSKDGMPMVIHDDRLDRTTNARKLFGRRRLRVNLRTAAEIRTLDANRCWGRNYSGTQVPLLGEALDWICGRSSCVFVERKSGDAVTCVKILRERRLSGRVMVISFDWEFLRQVHEIDGNLPLGVLGPPVRTSSGRRVARRPRKLTARWLHQLTETGAQAVIWNRRIARAGIELAHAAGLRVFVYTIDEPRLARRLVDAGVDGIITNRVKVVRTALGRK